MAKQTKITKSAKGEECQVRLPGICNFNNETTVFAHIGKGGGMGAKVDDIHGAYCCSDCHKEIDGQTMKMKNREQVELYSWHGVQRTQILLVNKELLKVA
jgi:hypothetical protein